MGSFRTDFNLSQFLANAHACCAGAWLAGVGLFLPLEGIAFAGLATLTAIRWRPTLEAIGDRSIRVPLMLIAGLIAWMSAACAWGESGSTWTSELPHRTYLGVLMVLGARLPAWGLLVSISVAGLWWGVGILVSLAGISDARAFVPNHPSVTFFGFTGLAVAGISVITAGHGTRVRAGGGVALLVALMGLSYMASRTSVVSVLVALVCCIAIRVVRTREWHGAAVAATVIASASLALPFLPVWTKAIAYLQREPDPAVEAHPNPVIELYRRAEPARGFLHEWTAVGILDRPVAGHGAGSWRFHWKRGDPHETEPPGRFAFWWGRMGSSVVHAHSIYLQTGYEYGLVGLGLTFGVCGSLAVVGLRRGLDVPATAALALLVAAATHGLADGALNTRYSAATLAVVVSLVACRTRTAARCPTGTLATIRE